MFRKLLNNYYYGKSGKGDYRKGDLPQNRWQQFREILRVRLAGLFRLNLMTALAFVPAIYVLIITLNALFAHLIIIAEVAADQAAASAEYLAIFNNSSQEVYSILFTGCLLLIPAIAITGPVQAGMALVTRNWARDEHAFVWSDFKDALRDNWQQALGVALITGLVPLVVYVSYQFYGQMVGQSIFFIVPQMLTLMLGLMWALALVYLYPLMVTYRLSFHTLIKNSLLLAVGRLPHTAGARLTMLVPAIIVALVAWFMPPYMLYALMILAAYYLMLGNALARFVYASLSNAVFDRYINSRMEGVPVNRGLATPEEDEYDEEGPQG